MGKNHKNQSTSASSVLGINHASHTNRSTRRTRANYARGRVQLPHDFEVYLTQQRQFTSDQMQRIKHRSNNGALKFFYDHLHSLPNLMDTHGFTQEHMTRIMSQHGSLHNLNAVFKHIHSLKTFCLNNIERIVSLASHTGASYSIEALCSQMRTTLLETHGFTIDQLVDLASKTGGTLKLNLLHQYASQLCQIYSNRAEIIQMIKESGSAAVLESNIREKLLAAQPINNTVVMNSVEQTDEQQFPMQQPIAQAPFIPYSGAVRGNIINVEDDLFKDILPDDDATAHMYLTQWNVNSNINEEANSSAIEELFDLSAMLSNNT